MGTVAVPNASLTNRSAFSGSWQTRHRSSLLPYRSARSREGIRSVSHGAGSLSNGADTVRHKVHILTKKFAQARATGPRENLSSGPFLGPRWEESIAQQQEELLDRRDRATDAVSSVILPSARGTLRSQRTSTLIPLRSARDHPLTSWPSPRSGPWSACHLQQNKQRFLRQKLRF